MLSLLIMYFFLWSPMKNIAGFGGSYVLMRGSGLGYFYFSEAQLQSTFNFDSFLRFYGCGDQFSLELVNLFRTGMYPVHD